MLLDEEGFYKVRLVLKNSSKNGKRRTGQNLKGSKKIQSV
jgi:hypothetical protein